MEKQKLILFTMLASTLAHIAMGGGCSSSAADGQRLQWEELLARAEGAWVGGRHDEARAAYLKAANVSIPAGRHEDGIWIAIRLGDLEAEDGRFERAKGYYRLALQGCYPSQTKGDELRPCASPALAARAASRLIHLFLHEQDDESTRHAEDLFEETLEHFPDEVGSERCLDALKKGHLQRDGAQVTHDKLLEWAERKPQSRVAARALHGAASLARIDLDNQDLAADHYRRLLCNSGGNNPFWDDAHMALAAILRSQEKLAEEEELLLAFLAKREHSLFIGSYQSPHHAHAALRLAVNRWERGLHEEGESSVRAFLAQFPHSRLRHEAKLLHAQYLFHLGESEEAFGVLSKLMEESPPKSVEASVEELRNQWKQVQ